MRYLGNKQRLLTFIESVIEKYNIEGESFADLFAGTSSVGDFFKDRYNIISNDFLYYSYIISLAKINNKDVPNFEKFKCRYKVCVFEWLNNILPNPNGNYFIYNNYSPKGGRMFFTEKNAAKIDAIRIAIEEIYSVNLIDDNEYAFLLASLLDSVSKISNTSGTFEAYFKFWDSRALKQFRIEPIEIKGVDCLKNNIVYNENANELARKVSGDIVYIDPPYTVSQYVSAYHMLETIAKYDYPEIKGVAGKRGRGDKNSLYARKNDALIEFEDLFRQLNFKNIIISYSNQGLVPIKELLGLAKKFAINGEVHLEYIDYQEYQNHRSSKKGNGKDLKECIIYFKKNLGINKSPLNYSGSKDKMVDKLVAAFPKHVPIFVDVMGGAFNVGANVVATEKVIYNDNHEKVNEVIRMLLETDSHELCDKIKKIIEKYDLDKKNKESYDSLRNSYNKSEDALLLFVLHMYSFQNMIRFNKSLKYNVPVGVAGYSRDMEERIKNFKPKTCNVDIICRNYRDIDYLSFPKDTLFYFDPPYFITSAAYNDGNRGYTNWSANDESKLLSILSMLNEKGYKFILSNVVEHKGKKNHLLIEWAKENNFEIENIGVSGWRYSKKEIIIRNYRRQL